MSSPENPPIDEKFDGLVNELRAARPEAPESLRQRVAAIAARPAAPPQTQAARDVGARARCGRSRRRCDRRRRAVERGTRSRSSRPLEAERAGTERWTRPGIAAAQPGADRAGQARAALLGGDHAPRQGSLGHDAGCAPRDAGARRLRAQRRLRRGRRRRHRAARPARADRARADGDRPLLGARHDPRPARVRAGRPAEARPPLRAHRRAAARDSDAVGRRAGRRAGRAGGAADRRSARERPAGELRDGVAPPDDEGRGRRADRRPGGSSGRSSAPQTCSRPRPWQSSTRPSSPRRSSCSACVLALAVRAARRRSDRRLRLRG